MCNLNGILTQQPNNVTSVPVNNTTAVCTPVYATATNVAVNKRDKGVDESAKAAVVKGRKKNKDENNIHFAGNATSVANSTSVDNSTSMANLIHVFWVVDSSTSVAHTPSGGADNSTLVANSTATSNNPAGSARTKANKHIKKCQEGSQGQ